MIGGRCFGTIVIVLAVATTARAMNREYLPGIEWQEPPIITPGENGGPPSDAVILFDGTDMSAWEGAENWTVADGVVTEGRGDIKTKQHFGDCQLHIEWSSPVPPRGNGQGRGNSGVFFHDRYELQVLDSYDNETYHEGQAGAIYKQMPPMVNAMRPPGEWNVYDIIWTAPKFNDDGSLKSPAYVTALHNGVLILNHFELLGDTFWPTVPSYTAHGPGPIKLQDHGNPVRFRNIWVREFKSPTNERVHEPKFHDHDTGREWLVSEGETPPGTATVSGTVSADGHTIPAGGITLQASENGRTFRARIADGAFKLEGVPPGEYSIAIGSRSGSDDASKLAPKYEDPATSGLRIVVEREFTAIDVNFDLAD